MSENTCKILIVMLLLVGCSSNPETESLNVTHEATALSTTDTTPTAEASPTDVAAQPSPTDVTVVASPTNVVAQATPTYVEPDVQAEPTNLGEELVQIIQRAEILGKKIWQESRAISEREYPEKEKQEEIRDVISEYLELAREYNSKIDNASTNDRVENDLSFQITPDLSILSALQYAHKAEEEENRKKIEALYNLIIVEFTAGMVRDYPVRLPDPKAPDLVPTLVQGQVGEHILLNGVGLTLMDAYTKANDYDAGDSRTCPEGCIILMIEVLMENIDQNSLKLHPEQFALYDSDEISYGQSDLELAGRDVGDFLLIRKRLSEGEQVEAKIPFVIPPDKNDFRLVYQVPAEISKIPTRDPFKGNRIEINLEKYLQEAGIAATLYPDQAPLGECTVLFTERTDIIERPPFDGWEAQGIWQVVHVRVKYSDTDSYEVVENDFSLRDSNGAAYSPAWPGSSSYSNNQGFNQFKFDKFPPGTAGEFGLLFDINPDATGLKLHCEQVKQMIDLGQ